MSHYTESFYILLIPSSRIDHHIKNKRPLNTFEKFTTLSINLLQPILIMNVCKDLEYDTTMFLDNSQIMDRLNVMKVQEATNYRCADYLSTLPSAPHHVDKWCRSKMIEWCFQVIDFIEFSRETVVIAITYLDRFMSSGSPRARQVLQDRKEFQLATMTAFYVAVKLHEPKLIDISLLTELSRGSYTEQDFKQMEMDLLSSLSWRLNGPTAITFLEHYIVLLPLEMYHIPIDAVLESARYQIELSLNDYALVGMPPSKVAVAAIVQSIKKVTASSKLASVRPKLSKALQDLCGIDLGSAGLRETLKLLEHDDEMQTIPSRRHSAPPILKPKRLRCRPIKKGSHLCSPRSVLNK